MSPPVPWPGLVIRYVFLWRHKAGRGAAEALKDRPYAIVVATRRDAGGVSVVVAPVTHSPPGDPEASIPIPPETGWTLGLDGEGQWLPLDEPNRFEWPGFDLRPVPGTADRWHHGMLPPDLFERLRRGLLEPQRKGRTTAVTSRD